MNRKTIFLTIIMIISILLCEKVNAAQSTSKINNPSMRLVVPVNGDTYSLTSSYNTITGAHSYVHFYDRTELSTSFASDSSRILEIALYEYDVGSNPDDLVKIYTYHFSGRLMDGVDITTIDSGNIDSSGDPTGEFYLRFVLHEVVDDDNYSAYTGTFFKYKISVS